VITFGYLYVESIGKSGKLLKPGLSPKNRDRNCGDGISRGEEGNKQVA
jgi:hypothetical protein